jgi:signal peptidase I
MSLARTAAEGDGPVQRATGPQGTTSGATTRKDANPPARSFGRELSVLVGIALVITLLIRAFVLQAFYIPSGSMQDTLHIGDRVLVSKLSYHLGDIHRGDVIVFNGTDSFAPEVAPPKTALGKLARPIGAFFGMAPSEHDFVKRVVGLPGDHVVCCTTAGLLSVNGVAVHEPYVYPGEPASTVPFNIVVPAGRLWVMGDHRSDSADSRSHIGDPGGGTVPEDRVIGKVVGIYWPFDRIGSPAGAPELAKVPAAAGAGGTR